MIAGCTHISHWIGQHQDTSSVLTTLHTPIEACQNCLHQLRRVKMVFQGQGHLQAPLGAGQGLDQQVAQAAEAQGRAHQVVSHLVVLAQAE